MSTVLIVDDNSAVCTALDLLLSLHGHKVFVAESPAEALALLDNLAVRAPRLKWLHATSAGVDGVLPLDWLPRGVLR